MWARNSSYVIVGCEEGGAELHLSTSPTDLCCWPWRLLPAAAGWEHCSQSGLVGGSTVLGRAL